MILRKRFNSPSSNAALFVLVLLVSGRVQAKSYFDDFDGSGNIAWTNATDDAGGDVSFPGTGVAHVQGGSGRRAYAYFNLTPAEASAGYTVTVKGKGLGGGGDQDPSIGLLFGGNGLAVICLVGLMMARRYGRR